MNRKFIALAVLGCSLAALSGCQHDNAGWYQNYSRYSAQRPTPTATDEVFIEEVSWPSAAHGPIAPGCEMVGEVQPFTVYGTMDEVGPDADRTLRPFAALKGANYVQWSKRYIGRDEVGQSGKWEYRALLFRKHWEKHITALRDQDL